MFVDYLMYLVMLKITYFDVLSKFLKEPQDTLIHSFVLKMT